MSVKTVLYIFISCSQAEMHLYSGYEQKADSFQDRTSFNMDNLLWHEYIFSYRSSSITMVYLQSIHKKIKLLSYIPSGVYLYLTFMLLFAYTVVAPSGYIRKVNGIEIVNVQTEDGYTTHKKLNTCYLDPNRNLTKKIPFTEKVRAYERNHKIYLEDLSKKNIN